MQKQDKALKIIYSKSGVSIVFVLAVMLLLMAIGTSALVAASASTGTGLNKQISDQLYLYSDSIHKSIMSSLKSSSDDENKDINSTVNAPSTLGGQILALIYNKILEDDTYSIGDDIILEIVPALSNETTSPNLSDIAEVVIRVIPSDNTSIVRRLEAQPALLDSDGNILIPARDRQLQSATIDGLVSVTLSVTYKGKSIASVAMYEFSDGFLEDDEDNSSAMLIKDAGEWSFVSYDKID